MIQDLGTCNVDAKGLTSGGTSASWSVVETTKLFTNCFIIDEARHAVCLIIPIYVYSLKRVTGITGTQEAWIRKGNASGSGRDYGNPRG